MRRKSNRLKVTLIASLLLMSCLTASGVQAWKKNLRFERLSTEDGLSHVLVGSIAQDHYGFMWFGTRNGLNKYDGYRFTFYGNDPNDPTSISAGQVMDVFVDSEGVLWAAADALNRFDREKDTFTRYSHDPDDPGSINGEVICIYEDHAGIMWFGTWNHGLNRYDRAAASFTHFRHDPDDPLSLPGGPVRAIYEDSDGVLWVGTYTHDRSANLVQFDRNTQTFKQVLSCPDNQGFFITVFPDLEVVVLAWFTYDTELPPDGAPVNLGDAGHRWLLAVGTFADNVAMLDIEIASGGLFDTSTEIERVTDGTIILSFEDCTKGTVEYDIPSIDRQGIVPIQRVAADNIVLCEALKSE